MVLLERIVVYKIICLNFPLAPSLPVPSACKVHFALCSNLFFFPLLEEHSDGGGSVALFSASPTHLYMLQKSRKMQVPSLFTVFSVTL